MQANHRVRRQDNTCTSKISYQKAYQTLKAVLGIDAILVRIRIRGSEPLTNGSGYGSNSGSDSFRQ
jgi:hypothetical protein